MSLLADLITKKRFILIFIMYNFFRKNLLIQIIYYSGKCYFTGQCATGARQIGTFILLCCVNTDLHFCRCMPTIMATLNSGEKIIFERTHVMSDR